MSIKVSSFILGVQRYFNDSTSATQTMIYDFINQRLVNIQAEHDFMDLRRTCTLTTESGKRGYTFDTLTEADVYGVVSVKNTETTKPLMKMSMVRYNEMVSDGESETGSPTHYIPVSDAAFYLYPEPNDTIDLDMVLQINHPFISAGSQTFDFSDDIVRSSLKEGVLADVYEYRGDDRFGLHEVKYQRALRKKKASNKRYLGGTSDRLLPGNSKE